MRIAVTQEDIEQGQRVQSQKCPIALALKRAGATDVSVGRVTAMVDGTHYHLPTVVEQFVADFDSGKEVEPFEFELLYPTIL